MVNMVNVETVHGVYVKLPNRPGTLEHLARVLAGKQVNIDAIALETIGQQGYARLLARHPKEIVESCRRAEIDAYETELVVAKLPNKPGELLRAAADLAAAGINVESVLSTPDGRLAFRTSDNELAARILGKL